MNVNYISANVLWSKIIDANAKKILTISKQIKFPQFAFTPQNDWEVAPAWVEASLSCWWGDNMRVSNYGGDREVISALGC